jgi:uncharacterized protein YgiB involved in biofilm formation
MNTMRKSRYITLLLAGAAATTLAACDQNVMTGQDETLYPDIAACTQERDAAECQSGFEAAQTEHAKQAPKFATKEECEAAGFQNCASGAVQNAGGGSFFMPMMMGYMMGRMLGGGMGMPPGQQQTGQQRTAATTARPVYGDRNGFLYSGGGAVGRVAPGTTSLGSRAIAMQPTARGGFGSSARGFGGGS